MEAGNMKRSKLISTFVVVPLLALAACSGSPSAVVQSSQNQVAAQAASTALVDTATTQTGTSDLLAFQSTLESVYDAVSPSVVSIEVVTTSTGSSVNGNNPFGGGSSTSLALGSGFVWDKSGNIVTNNHVVDGASSITVTFIDGTTAVAKVVGTDPNSDLAVINVSVNASELVPVTLADSTQVQVGDIAIAIGNPYGLSWTMTQGIISGLSRSIPSDVQSSTSSTSSATYSIPDIIQTDAAINPGNSGGVLVDVQGQVIGVTAAIESSSGANAGVGYVIPSQIVQKVIPVLISNGSYDHPYLGITGSTLTSDLATAMDLSEQQKGVLVIDVTSGGPADLAGMIGSTKQVTINGQTAVVGGDVITAIDGQAVTTMEDLSSYLFLDATAGQPVTLTIIRNGTQTTLDVTTGTMPKS
jgi:serine protease Do